jgi:hypothetical protein
MQPSLLRHGELAEKSKVYKVPTKPILQDIGLLPGMGRIVAQLVKTGITT